MWADQPIRDWIETVCRQFSRAMGCALTFDPLGETASPSPAGRETGEQWRATISDGTQTVGVLRLRSRTGDSRDAGFLRACETAELTAHLIERVVITRAAEELSVWGPPRPRTTSRRRELRDNAQPSNHVSETPNITDRLERLLDVIRRLTGFPAAALFVHDPETGRMRLGVFRATDSLALHPEEIASLPAVWGDGIFDGRLTVLRRSMDPVERWAALPPEIATGVVQSLGGSDATKGVLCLFDRRDRRLSHRDRHLLATASQRLERLLDQAMLLDESSNSRKLNIELRAASRTQPSSSVEYNAPGGWCELAGCMQSVRGIGGDLCEVIPLSHERLFVAIGDAAGHSIPAALVMANVRGALRALIDGSRGKGGLPAGRPPQEVLERVNAVLHGIVQSHQFMTLFCGILDRPTLTFEYANAGHPQPLLVRDGQVERLESHGLVLGVTDDVAYERAVLRMREEDVLTFYTDGVTEAVCRARTLFGAEGIEESVRRQAGHSAMEIRDRLWLAMQTHLAGSRQNDDRTLAVLRIAGR